MNLDEDRELNKFVEGMKSGGLEYLKDYFKSSIPKNFINVMEACMLSRNFKCMKYWFDKYNLRFECDVSQIIFMYDDAEFFRYCHGKTKFTSNLITEIVVAGAINCLKYWHSLGNKITQQTLTLSATSYPTFKYCYNHAIPGCEILETTLEYSLHDVRSFKYCLSKGGIVTQKIADLINEDSNFKDTLVKFN